jgi:predicted TIM-barrel fold metal-dependent hydrolase
VVAFAIDALRRRLPPLGVVRAWLRAPELRPRRPRFAAIDAHVHLNSAYAGRWAHKPAKAILGALDNAGVEGLVDLDGGYGDALSAEIARVQRPDPARMVVFAGIDIASIARHPDFGTVEADRLRDSVDRGARGLKIWKTLGLKAVDAEGRLVALDDGRLAPLWEAAAEVGVPVLIHVGDPPAFFRPLDASNEREAELRRNPEWHYYPVRTSREGPGYPSHAELIGQFEKVVLAHPRTSFIGAHLASCGDDLPRLAAMLRAAPNLAVDIAARINELGRTAAEARAFVIDFQDRVLFGTDAGPDPRWYPVYVTFLESAVQSMNYSIFDPPLQGNWRIDALELPDDVLAKVYGENARRLIRFGP